MTQPASPILNHLTLLHQDAQLSIASSVSGCRDELGKILQLDIDIKTWEQHLIDRPEIAQIAAARRDLAFAIYAAASGSYSHAYAGLRTFLELGFAAIHFSVHELARRQWLSDRKDFSWSQALDEDSGVLSPMFVREFNEPASLESGAYALRAAQCYRHCSQFIHGKAAVTKLLPETLTYSKQVLSDWSMTARKSAESILFLLFCRYGEEIKVQDYPDLSATLEYSFSHLVVVRQTLGLPIH